MIKKIFALLFIILFSITIFDADSSNYFTDSDFQTMALLDKYGGCVPLPIDSSNKYMADLQEFAQRIGQKLNGVMLVARHDTIFFQDAFGKLQLYKSCKGYTGIAEEQLATLRNEDDNAMMVNAIFDLASVSKQFTAAAILKLCADGKIALTDKLGQFFPELPYKSVTIKQMLNHTSGIPEYFKFSYNEYDTSEFVDNDQLLKVLAKGNHAKAFYPGSQYAYTNTNYAILASIVAKVSGMSFEEYVRQNLWEPAGMKSTCFFTELIGLCDHTLEQIPAEKGQVFAPARIAKDKVSVPVARGHWKSGSVAQYDRLNAILGDKGVYSNAEDLVRWTNAYFIEHKIIPEEWVNEATKIENRLSNGTIPEDYYGYGLHIEKNALHGYIVFHGGLWNGFHNLWLYRPKDGLQVVFLSNYYNASHMGKGDEVVAIIDKL